MNIRVLNNNGAQSNGVKQIKDSTYGVYLLELNGYVFETLEACKPKADACMKYPAGYPGQQLSSETAGKATNPFQN